MKKLCLFLLIVTLTNEAFSLNLRYKRQSEGVQGDLGDRYGWYIPSQYDYAFDPQQFWNYQDYSLQRPWPERPLLTRPWRPIRPDRDPSTKLSTTTPTTNTNPPNQSDIEACQRSCPVTSEYNPVCGTDNRDYNNPGRLFCAQACGVNVQLLRQSRCPPPTPAAP